MTRKSTKEDSTIKVTVAQVGEEVKTLLLPEDSTVEQALEKAGYAGHSARVNGEEVDAEDILEDGDEIFVGKAVKGGAVK
jgi:sulfur carrier protein ThiS